MPDAVAEGNHNTSLAMTLEHASQKRSDRFDLMTLYADQREVHWSLCEALLIHDVHCRRLQRTPFEVSGGACGWCLGFGSVIQGDTAPAGDPPGVLLGTTNERQA
jgi:hypothetical protein